MSFEIQKNVAIPAVATRTGAGSIYPFAQMEIGDSFAFPADDKKKVSGNAISFAKKRGLKFVVRNVDETGVDGEGNAVKLARCWRVEKPAPVVVDDTVAAAETVGDGATGEGEPVADPAPASRRKK